MKKILLTGGGTAGHVTPNIALLPKLQEENYEIYYMGSYDGIERKLIEELGIPYYGISSGKLRRYFSTKNFSDPFRVIKGFFEARKLIRKLKPTVLFSKGGFVSVPVVVGAKLNRVPIIIHESDITPGLANKIAIPFATKVCHNFPETASHLPLKKAVLTGSPIRQELFQGDKNTGLKLCGFSSEKPCIMVIGGSQGSNIINKAIRNSLPSLLENYQIIHLCGKNKSDSSLQGLNGYCQFEYVKENLKDLFAASDVIISRAGANTICEIAALKKPSILIPLSAKASRGDQILNATSFKKQGFCEVLEEENLSEETLMETINSLLLNRSSYEKALETSVLGNGVNEVMALIGKVQ